MTNQTITNQQTLADGQHLTLSQLSKADQTLTVIQLKGDVPSCPEILAGDDQSLILTEAAVAELRQQLLALEPTPPGDPLGKLITDIRALRPAELAALDWAETYPILSCPVLVLSDGTYLYPTQDEEGNGPGCLWGRTPAGQDVTILLEVERREANDDKP